MITSNTVLATSRRRGWLARSFPALLETLGVVAAIVLLLPFFDRVAQVGVGRDQRFAELSFPVRGLPPPALPAVCSAAGSLAEPALRERLCAGSQSGAPASSLTRLPLPLADALTRTTRAFLERVEIAQARLAELRLRQREGIGDLLGLSDAIAAIEADTEPFIERFQLAQTDLPGPAPLVCATRRVEAVLADSSVPAGGDATHDIARANAVLLLAAALDGHAATEALADTALLPASSAPLAPACSSMDLRASVSSAASLMSDARQSLLNSRKNEATRALFQTAGWQWAGAMLIGLVLVNASRTRLAPAFGVAASLALWAVAAWAGRVPWPLGGTRNFEPARIDAAMSSPPANFVIALGAAALVLLLFSGVRRVAITKAPQAMSSRIGYPGLVWATGLGWLLLLDLSAHAHVGNRYLALYHQGHLWLAMLVFSVVLFLRQPLARALAWTLSIAGEATHRAARRIGSARAVLLAILATLVAVTAAGLAFANMRQLTSELGRLWLIVGGAWFFFLRGDPLAERLARSGRAGASLLRYMGPLLFVAAVLVVFMLVTRDMGPLLIAGYAAGGFVAASLAMWWHQRSGQRVAALLLAVVLFIAWIAATTSALFKLGAVHTVTATRLESLAAPLASGNDQLALVSWFQRATPPDGFGIGNVPWCGYASAGRCGGVPAQIHSDYTFTAIVGAFGTLSAWIAALACAVWLHRLIRHHGRVTHGEPRFIALPGRVGYDGQAFMSWIAVAWVALTLCQLAVTVAGNLAVLPLTGVTFPFVSFGMTSLVVNMAFLALCLNVDLH